MANQYANMPVVGYMGMAGIAGDGVSAPQYAAILARLDALEGSPHFTGSITTDGNANLGNSASDTVTLYRLATAGNTPTLTVGAAMGSSPGAQTISGNDTSGYIIQNVGTSATTGVLWTVTFAVARSLTTYTARAYPMGTNSAGAQLYTTNRTVNGFDIACKIAPSDSTQIAVNWLVIE